MLEDKLTISIINKPSVKLYKLSYSGYVIIITHKLKTLIKVKEEFIKIYNYLESCGYSITTEFINFRYYFKVSEYNKDKILKYKALKNFYYGLYTNTSSYNTIRIKDYIINQIKDYIVNKYFKDLFESKAILITMALSIDDPFTLGSCIKLTDSLYYIKIKLNSIYGINLLTLYDTILHELRHVYQFITEFKFDYDLPYPVRPQEIDANIFAKTCLEEDYNSGFISHLTLNIINYVKSKFNYKLKVNFR